MNTNEKNSTKTSSVASRLNVLYIILVLKNYSSPKKPMSIKEITEKVNSDYYHIFSDEDSINHSTVSRILDALCTDVSLGCPSARCSWPATFPARCWHSP